jgi:hypothetical protein
MVTTAPVHGTPQTFFLNPQRSLPTLFLGTCQVFPGLFTVLPVAAVAVCMENRLQLSDYEELLSAVSPIAGRTWEFSISDFHT